MLFSLKKKHIIKSQKPKENFEVKVESHCIWKNNTESHIR